MSHTVEIKDTHFANFKLLTQAFETLGWEIKEKCKARTYRSDPARDNIYDFVAVNPSGQFDLGIMEEDGEYKIYGDFYDRSLAQQLGNELSSLKTQYNFKLSKYLLEEQELEYEVEEDEEMIEIKVSA